VKTAVTESEGIWPGYEKSHSAIGNCNGPCANGSRGHRGSMLLAGAVPAIAEWRFAHANRANTGVVMVETVPAYWPSGRLHGAGCEPGGRLDGTVYVGNLHGELRAFHADGTPCWTREINSTHGGIFAATAIGADGSIYVVLTIHYRDRGGVIDDRNRSFPHKFSPGGGLGLPRDAHRKAHVAAALRGAQLELAASRDELAVLLSGFQLARRLALTTLETFHGDSADPVSRARDGLSYPRHAFARPVFDRVGRANAGH
jgi:hypothetical protein